MIWAPSLWVSGEIPVRAGHRRESPIHQPLENRDLSPNDIATMSPPQDDAVHANEAARVLDGRGLIVEDVAAMRMYSTCSTDDKDHVRHAPMDFATVRLGTKPENMRLNNCSRLSDAPTQSVSDQTTSVKDCVHQDASSACNDVLFEEIDAQLDHLRKARRTTVTLRSCSDAAAAAEGGQGLPVCASEGDCVDEKSLDGDATSDYHPQDDVDGRASTASTRRRSTGTDGPVLEYSVRSSWSGDSSFENPVSTDARPRSACLLSSESTRPWRTILVDSAVSESSRIRTSPVAGNDALAIASESQNLKQPTQCPARGLQGGVDCSQQASAGDEPGQVAVQEADISCHASPFESRQRSFAPSDVTAPSLTAPAEDGAACCGVKVLWKPRQVEDLVSDLVDLVSDDQYELLFL